MIGRLSVSFWELAGFFRGLSKKRRVHGDGKVDDWYDLMLVSERV